MNCARIKCELFNLIEGQRLMRQMVVHMGILSYGKLMGRVVFITCSALFSDQQTIHHWTSIYSYERDHRISPSSANINGSGTE